MPKRFLILVVWLALIAHVAACANDQSVPANNPKPLPTASPPTASPVSIVTRPLASSDVTDDTAREHVLVVPNFCLSFDPAIDSASGGREIYRLPLVREIHAGLARISSDIPPAIELDLAEQFTVSDNHSTYTFKLRKGLMFSDGTPITSSDVKWSWERALRLSTPWGAGSDVLGNIVGAPEVIKDGERIREVQSQLMEENPLNQIAVDPEVLLSGVRVIDAQTVEVSLNKPDPEFLDNLSRPVSFVLKESNVDSWNVAWNNNVFPGVEFGDIRGAVGLPLPDEALPVGAGPFKLISYDPSAEYQTCAIARNEHYWDAVPRIDGVIFVPPDVAFGLPVDSAFVAEHVDVVILIGEKLTPETVVVSSQRPPFTRFMALNPTHPPLDDVEVRRALLASNDLEKVYAPNEVGWPNTIVPHRLVPAYDYCDRSQYVDPARQSLGTSDLEDYTVDFWWFESDYILERVITLLKQWHSASGVKHEIKNLEPEDIETLMTDGALHIRLMEISPSVPSITPVFHSMIGMFGGEPHEEWADVEAMILDAMQESDNAKRFDAFRNIECHLYDRALVLPMLVDWIDFEINTQPWVTGLEMPTFGTSVFKDVQLDETVPERVLPK